MAEPPFGCEPSGIAVRRILAIGAVLAVGVIVTVISVHAVLEHRLEPTRAGTLHTEPIPPAPRLQAHPQDDLAALRAQKQTLLESWGWTDATRQFARIPIERAMAIYARQHEPANGSGGSAPTSAPEGRR
jgi:hypothetical protein